MPALHPPDLAAAILDSLDDQIAVMAQDGTLLYCNRAWRAFAEANGVPPGHVWIGTNYLSVCHSAARSGERDGQAVAAGIAAVLDGSIAEFRYEYPCHSPEARRWFTLHLAAVHQCPGLYVAAHHNITARKLSEERVAELNAELERLSFTDRLTQIGNRRRLDLALQDEIARSERYGVPLAVVLFDIDHFKPINDTQGHAAGDAALARVAALVAGACRHSDVAGRWGGDEFMVLMPECDAADAQRFAGKLHDLLAAEYPCSFGVAAYRSGDSGQALLLRADRALYQAKQAGRNRVCAA